MPETQETQVQSLGQEDLLEKEMATHSSILYWKVPWTEEPEGLQSMGSQRVRQDWAHTDQKGTRFFHFQKRGPKGVRFPFLGIRMDVNPILDSGTCVCFKLWNERSGRNLLDHLIHSFDFTTLGPIDAGKHRGPPCGLQEAGCSRKNMSSGARSTCVQTISIETSSDLQPFWSSGCSPVQWK